MTFLNELTTFLSWAGNPAETRGGGGELQSPCAPHNVQNLTSNHDFCTPEVPLKSSSGRYNSFGKVEAKFLLAGEIRLVIHLLEGKHAVKESQTLKC